VDPETCDESCPVPRDPCNQLELAPGSLSIRQVYGQRGAMVTLRRAACRRAHRARVTSEGIAECTTQLYAERCANLKPGEPLA